MDEETERFIPYEVLLNSIDFIESAIMKLCPFGCPYSEDGEDCIYGECPIVESIRVFT